MYYIKPPSKLFKKSFQLHVLPSLVVFLVLCFLTIIAWGGVRENTKTEEEATVKNLANETQRTMRDHMQSYEIILQGAVGLVSGSSEVVRQDWSNFVKSYDLLNRYPGVQGLGYAPVVQASDLSGFIDRTRANDVPSFRVFPQSNEAIVTPILYYEPLSDATMSAIGFNIYGEPVRHKAIERARSTGKASLSGQVNFIRNENEVGDKGFVLYQPIYRKEDIAKAPNDRQVIALAYAPFSAKSFFTYILTTNKDTRIGIKIDDKDSGSTLHETTNYQQLLAKKDSYRYSLPIELYSQHWTAQFVYDASIVAEPIRQRPINTLIFGITLSIVLASFIFMILLNRNRSLAAKEEHALQAAKDELLSLASHQLRTPATGVKQYINMLREGFAGPLTDQQHKFLDKAHIINERQLGIINELLYVAKIDANGIVLSPRRINITQLLEDILQELRPSIKAKQHRLVTKLPKRAIYLTVDEQSLRMVLENVINNAIKYSYDKGSVSVTLKTTKDSVIISVCDKGIGIAQEELELLFQRFSRIPNELSQVTSGSGIGLYLSKKLTQLHGGSINVQSEKGKGSCFVLTFPK